MSQQSAGILLYRLNQASIEVLLVHPGGPFWIKKDSGAWSIPKGEFSTTEDPLTAAKREFEEETGSPISGEFIQLHPIRQKSGKIIQAWAIEGNIDAEHITSNTFELEWPPKSGKKQQFPEVDKASWFTVPVAKQKIIQSQVLLIDQLIDKLESYNN